MKKNIDTNMIRARLWASQSSMVITFPAPKNLFHNQARVRRRRGGMQVEEESPKQYVDIARAPDKEMRPRAGACRLRVVNLPLGDGRRRGVVARRPVLSGVAARTVGCIVALLDHIDIWPSSGALHPVRPGRNAS